MDPALPHDEPVSPATTTAEIRLESQPRPSRWRLAWNIFLLVVALVVLYGLAPQLLALWAEIPRLREVNIPWFLVMLLLESASYVCAWWLIRLAVPHLSWFVAGTGQLWANAVSKIVPGGAAMGAAAQFRMFAAAGVEKATAATALAAASIISNGVLFALPLVAVLGSILGAPVPGSLTVVAWGGAALFVVLFAFSFVVVRYDRPLHLVGRLVERSVGWVYARIGRTNGPTGEGLVRQRDQMVDALGDSWWEALLASVGNWMFDYLALVAALIAVGDQPRLSLVLLAYAVAAVLSMIPITPGGLGFVEAGLTATLVVAGVSPENALLATLAYRIVSYWLPLPAGFVANVAFRRRYGRPGGEVAGAG